MTSLALHVQVPSNVLLVIGAALSTVAALLHFACIFVGAPAFSSRRRREAGPYGRAGSLVPWRGGVWHRRCARRLCSLRTVRRRSSSASSLSSHCPRPLRGSAITTRTRLPAAQASVPGKLYEVLAGKLGGLPRHGLGSCGWAEPGMVQPVRPNPSLKRTRTGIWSAWPISWCHAARLPVRAA